MIYSFCKSIYSYASYIIKAATSFKVLLFFFDTLIVG
jgi:hypothetical protein